jgi:transposase
VFAAVIAPPVNTRIWIAAGVTDLRRGFMGLSALVQTKLEQSPMSGHVFVFRGRRGDLIKLLWFGGDGLCLFFQTTGARSFQLAASDERYRVSDTGAAIDVIGRH